MVEQIKPFENKKNIESTPRPNLLDVVKIDGRWAQVTLGGRTIHYLDDKSDASIDWDDYKLTKNWEELPIFYVKKLSSFEDEELNHIHWGPEQEEYQNLREQVRVFGEFEKKSKKNKKNYV